jgi:hypothetical protein
MQWPQCAIIGKPQIEYMSSTLPQIADQAGSPIDAGVSAADMTGAEDLEKAAERVRHCGNYLIFARGERSGSPR